MAAPLTAPAGTDAHVHLKARAPSRSPTRSESPQPDPPKTDGRHSGLSSWFHRSPKADSTSEDPKDASKEESHREPRPAPKSGHNKPGHRTHTTIAGAGVAGGRF
ncbi:hypothetical protein PspLS_01574 [Pyricularia sp. CBS 133598]|nr:hypothetical protein PspLS_01574 [Pyricularia sp. CBS 133598]